MLLRFLLLFGLLHLTACNGCSEGGLDNTTPIDFKLNWSVYGEHAAFFVAEELGFFHEQGLEVNIIPGNGSGSTVQMVAAGTFSIGYADTGTQIKSSASGYVTRNVAVFTQTSPMSLVTLADGSLKSWEELRGKTIGITVSDAASALFKIILGKLSILESEIKVLKIANPSGRGKALLQGRIDAFLGYHINEPHKIEYNTNRKMSWLPVVDLGVEFLSSGIVVNPEFLKGNPATVHKFVKAAQKGLQFVIENPHEAAKILANHTEEFDVTTAESMIRDHLTLVRTQYSRGMPLGWSSAQDWDRTIEFLRSYYDFRGKVDKDDFYTTEFVK